MSSQSKKLEQFDASSLNKVIRAIVLNAAEEFMPHSFTIEDHPSPDDFVYGEWMTLIMIHSHEIITLIKVHYTPDAVKSFAKNNEMTQADIADYVGEFVNIIAGRIVDAYSACQIQGFLSIPVTTPGYDEIIASDIIETNESRDYMVLKSQDQKCTVTSSHRLRATDMMKRLSQLIKEPRKIPKMVIF